MKEEVFKNAAILHGSISKAQKEIEGLNNIPFDTFKKIQIGNGDFTTNEELTKQIIQLIVSYKEKQIEQWKEEFEKL